MWKKLAIALVLILFFANASWAQCAMCRATVGSNLSEGRGVIGTGLNFGILYLLATPYILLGGLVLAWYRTAKKDMKKKIALNRKLQGIYGK